MLNPRSNMEKKRWNMLSFAWENGENHITMAIYWRSTDQTHVFQVGPWYYVDKQLWVEILVA